VHKLLGNFQQTYFCFIFNSLIQKLKGLKTNKNDMLRLSQNNAKSSDVTRSFLTIVDHCRLVSKIFEIYKFGENNSVLIQGGLGCLILQVQNYRKGCSQILKFSRGIKGFLFQITFEVLRLEGEEGSLCCHLQHNSN
jgi:hypothetical protein